MKLTKVFSVFGALLFFVSNGSAQQDFTELSGELTGTLTSNKPYLVVGDIYIPPGSSVTMEPGTVLLFTGFTGLHVQGTLYAKGTERQPILFTSQYDSLIQASASVAPAPFDWNGIDIYESAVGSELLYCNIRYSVYGVRSQTEYCKIVSSAFDHNGKADFSVKDMKKSVLPGELFSYSSLQIPVVEVPASPSEVTAVPEPVPAKPQSPVVPAKKRGSTGIRILRYGGLLLGAGCGAYSAFSYVKEYEPAAREFDDLSDLDELEMRTKTSDDWSAARQKRNTALVHTLSGAAGAVLGLLSFSLSFAF